MHAQGERTLNGQGLALLSVAAFTLLSATMITPALPALSAAFARTPHAALLAKLVLTTTPLFIGLAGPLAGIAIGRVGRPRMLMASVVLAAVSGSICGALNSLPALLIGRAILGAATAGMMVSVTTLIGDLYRGDMRMHVLGLQSAAMKFGGFAFLILGGVLAAISWRAAFAGHLLTLAVLPGILMFVREPAPVSAVVQRVRAPIEIGFLALVCGIAFFGQVVFFAIPTQVPFLMTERFGSPPQIVGLVVSATTLFGMVSAVGFRSCKARMSFVVIAAAALATTALAFWLLATATSVQLVCVALALIGLAFGLLLPDLNAWVLARTLPQLRGRNVGALTMAMFLGQFASPLVVQPFVAASGVEIAFMLIASACAFAAIVLGLLQVLRARVALEPAA